MDSVRSYLFTNETLGIWTLFSEKIDSPVIKTLETHFFTRESNFDGKSVKLPRVSFVNK